MKKITALLLICALLSALAGSAWAAGAEYDFVYRHGDPDEVPRLEELDETVIQTEEESGVRFVTVANVFHVSHGSDELLQAVKLNHTECPQGVVSIVTGLTDPTVPDSGVIESFTLDAAGRGYKDYPFYFDEPILLKSDSWFSVIFSVVVTDETEGLLLRSAAAASQGGESFIVGADGYWYDISASDEGASVFCISACTDAFVCLHNWLPVSDTEKQCTVCGDTKERDYAPDHFADIGSDSAYYDAIVWALENGITTGTDATHFAPSKSCTRAQIVTFLWRAAGCPEPETAVNPFTDVKSSSDYYKAILWAVEQDITTGTSATTFSPNAYCSRGQIVTFLWRAVGCPEPENKDMAPIVDIDIGTYYYTPVLWAIEQNITTGTDSTHFSPKRACTRAQAVTFLYRLLAGAGE